LKPDRTYDSAFNHHKQSTRPNEEGLFAGRYRRISQAPSSFSFDGLAQTFTFPDLAAFLDRLKRAHPNEAFVYGVLKQPSTRIGCLSSPAVKSGEAQARARESFEWPGRSILMIDCDGVSMDWTAAHKAITACHAGLAGAACVVSHSASAGLYQTSTGRQLTGLDSFHLYWIVGLRTSHPRIGYLPAQGALG